MIDHEKLSEEGRENMLIAKKNTDRMLRLINQLLDFRKIQNNKMKLYIEETDIVSLSKKSLKLLPLWHISGILIFSLFVPVIVMCFILILINLKK